MTGPSDAAPAAETFASGWLALREPFDLAARAEALARLDLQAALFRAPHGVDPMRVLDLGCGTGANLRALAPKLGRTQQHWTLVDHDPLLLGTLAPAMAHWCTAHGFEWLPVDAASARIAAPAWQATLHWQQTDLAAQLDVLPLDGQHLVTASALLDLVAGEWLQRLLIRVAATDAALLFALTVDGRHAWSPRLVGDARVQAQFASHQRRDKGLGGPALGPDALPFAVQALARLGYTHAQAASDWRIEAKDQAMLLAMIDGLADAAMAQAPQARAGIEAWRLRRRARAEETRLRVGHADLLAWRQ